MPAKPYFHDFHDAHVPLWREDEPEAAVREEIEEEQRFVHWLHASQEIVQEHKDASGWEEPDPGPLKRLSARLRHRGNRNDEEAEEDTDEQADGGTDEDAAHSMAVIAHLPQRRLADGSEHGGKEEAVELRESARVARRR